MVLVIIDVTMNIIINYFSYSLTAPEGFHHEARWLSRKRYLVPSGCRQFDRVREALQVTLLVCFIYALRRHNLLSKDKVLPEHKHI